MFFVMRVASLFKVRPGDDASDNPNFSAGGVNVTKPPVRFWLYSRAVQSVCIAPASSKHIFAKCNKAALLEFGRER